MRAISRPQPRRDDGLIPLDLSQAGKIARTLFHIRTHVDPEHFQSTRHASRGVVHWLNAQLKLSFALLIFAVVIDTKQICSLSRWVAPARSLSRKKPKVNFFHASSCECGMEISTALSRLSISFSISDERTSSSRSGKFLHSTIEKVGARERS